MRHSRRPAATAVLVAVVAAAAGCGLAGGGDAPDSAQLEAILASESPFSTNVPLDSARIVAVLNAPTSAVLAARLDADSLDRIQRDARRLDWLLHMVGLPRGDDPVAWVADARRRMAAEAAEWQAAPRGAAVGTLLATRIERVPDAELLALMQFREALRARRLAQAAPVDYIRVHPDDPEARAWLAQGDDKVVLAGNRFGTAPVGVRFIDLLYAAGAAKVVIAQESIQLDRGTSSADAIRVILPADPGARARLFRILNEEATRGGYDPELDTGQSVFYMWWD